MKLFIQLSLRHTESKISDDKPVEMVVGMEKEMAMAMVMEMEMEMDYVL